MSQMVQTFALTGGLDTSSAALMVKPGAAIYAVNYEPLAEGYGRVDGYERFDGGTAPSASAYTTLAFDAGLIEIEVDDVVTGLTSSATGTVVVAPYGVTGAWGSTAAGTLVMAGVTGTFQDNEALRVGGLTHATAAGAPETDSAPDDDTDTEWRIAAMEWRRGEVEEVPGEGPVRGVAVHDGEVYAWRDNVGQTESGCFRATTAGWTALSAASAIAFTSGGTYEVNEGDTITGATSSATATVSRITISSGSWAAGTAAGTFHLTGITGTFGAENLNVGANLNVATIAGAPTAYTFEPGGRYRTISHNFYGAANRYRLYGASGVDKAFEIAGDVMVPITTGMNDDRPQRVFEIGQQLGLTFAGGSIQISATGEPLDWTVTLGAGEFGLGTEITDVVQANETAVAVFGAQKIGILQGHDVDDFVFETLTEEAGADADTAQRIARTVYVDRRGLRSLDASQSFGNFKAGALSDRFEAHFKAKRKAGLTAIGSLVSRTKSQYRIFWSDGTGLSVFMGRKAPEALPFELGIVPTCFGQGEMTDGEGLFVGADDGFVYRLDSGTNFDGEAIDAALMPAFNHLGSPLQNKRLHKVTLELTGPSSATITISVQFDYANPSLPIAYGGEFAVRGGGGLWDQAVWNAFSWSDPLAGTAECYLDGMGRNMGFVFATTAGLLEEPHVLQAYGVHFSPRKVAR